MKLAKNFYQIHSDPGLNFTLNRLAWTIPVEELKNVAKQINSLKDWVKEMLTQAKSSEEEGNLVVAARYYQAAEFYMPFEHPEKKAIYNHSIDLIGKAMPELSDCRFQIPYEDGFLPALKLQPVDKPVGTIVCHGGFDSLIEEMFPILESFSKSGFLVIGFEGPGQGGALRNHKLRMTYDWEKPVCKVLDFFKINECTLIGMSLGGYLAARASAYDKRVHELVCWGALYDFTSAYKLRLGERKFKILEILLNLKLSLLVNHIILKAAKDDDILFWALQHGMHVSGTSSPYDFYQWVRTINLKDSAHLINCHSFLVMGNEDHLVPTDQLYEEAKSMINAKSVKTLMLSKDQLGAEHCQIGNPELVINRILGWLNTLKVESKS